MPSSTLLPTPLPANRPMRWPRPTVSSALIARTPTSSGFGDRLAIDRVERPAVRQWLFADVGERPLAVDRAGRAVDDAAEQAVADRHVR